MDMRGEDRPKRHRLAPQSGVAARLMERRYLRYRRDYTTVRIMYPLRPFHIVSTTSQYFID